MRGWLLMKLIAVVMVLLALGACCIFGGQLTDGPEIELLVSATWGGEVPPVGSTASVDFYVLAEGIGTWNPIQLDVPYPEEAGVLVDTFRFEYEVPTSGARVTYRYEVDLTVAGVTYTAEAFPELACESGEWWWYFGGAIWCEERKL